MWRIDPAGDRALLVRLGTEISPQRLAQVLALDRELSNRHVPGLVATLPAYASLLCRYEPRLTNAGNLEALIRDIEPTIAPADISGAVVEVPTVYDGQDLATVASTTGLSIQEVIDVHAGREYIVYGIGFAPGFTYCGEVDRRIAIPRKSSPRARVAAGSVAIAGGQTGIYAVTSPGGWNIIGRTELVLFDPNTDPPARFKPGNYLRFVPT